MRQGRLHGEIIMEIIRDLAGGGKPSPITVFYNGEDDADATEKRYRGSLVKLMDWDNGAGGVQFTWAGETTAFQSLAGILAEDQGTSGNYLLNDAAYGANTRKMYPLLPTSIIRAEYAQTDADGSTALTDTNFTGSTTTVTCADGMTVASTMVGGWLYFTNGAAASQLHYVTANTTAGAMTVATSVAATLDSTDDVVVVNPPHCLWVQTSDEEVHLTSNVEISAQTVPVVGLGTFIKAPGIPYQRLSRDKHDGLTIANAKFYHEFIIGGSATLGNIWRDTVVRA